MPSPKATSTAKAKSVQTDNASGAVDAATLSSTVSATSPVRLNTMETAELLGISTATLHKRVGDVNCKLKPVAKDGKANVFDLDEVLAYQASIPARQTATKVDPLERMHEVAKAYQARGIPVWNIKDAATKVLLGVLPGATEQQASFNALRRFKGVKTTITPYE